LSSPSFFDSAALIRSKQHKSEVSVQDQGRAAARQETRNTRKNRSREKSNAGYNTH
jgi:hypothetical protein